MRKYRPYILLCAIVLLALFLRFYNLGSIPSGLQQDESSIGYNAYSILQTGKDEYGKSFPITFKAFGEYKLPLSIYLASGSIAAFGVNEFAVRFPSAFFGLLTVILVYFLVKILFQNHTSALVSALLLAVNPWHIHFSRGAYEVTPALFFITLGVYLFLLFLKKKSVLFLSSALSAFVIAMYGYNTARLFIPVLIILLGVLFLKKIIASGRKKLLVSIIFPGILLIPFSISVFSSGGFQSTKGTLIPTSAVVQAYNLEIRSYVVQTNPLAAKLIFNKPVSDAIFYIKNVVSYFDGNFFFANGSPHGNHGIGNVGLFYVWELATIIVGVSWLFRKRDKIFIVIAGWIVSVILIASLTREAPQATRSFFAVVPLSLLSSIGFIEILKKILQQKVWFKTITLGIVLFVGLYNFSYYAISYFYKFPVEYAKEYRSEDKRLAQELKNLESKYNEIYLDNSADILYSSLAFNGKFPPSEFQKSAQRMRDDSEGFSTVISFGKYIYINPENINSQQKFLLVSNEEKPGFTVVKKLSYPARPVVVAKGQEILNFPVEETAYVLLEKN